jgi:site-specific recombinase XerD
MKTAHSLPTLLRGFFEDYLVGQRDVSPNTILAYRDAFLLFLRFAAQRNNRQVIRLELEDLGPATLQAFLNHLETERRNCVATRNYRLVAIHRFFAYVAASEPLYAQLCRRILDVPVKKATTCPMTYLERDEVKAVLAAPQRSDPMGLRDLTLLTFLYNTGARVSEAVALDTADVRLETPAQVCISGKGRKQRWCPLWAETAELLRAFVQQRRPNDQSQQPLFVNARGHRLSRHGVNVIIQRHILTATKTQPSLKRKRVGPHTFRHTAAMHLLQAGVELNVIRAWLGHVSITTTSQYIEIDMKMKHEALQRCQPPLSGPAPTSAWRLRKDIVQWLHDL